MRRKGISRLRRVLLGLERLAEAAPFEEIRADLQSQGYTDVQIKALARSLEEAASVRGFSKRLFEHATVAAEVLDRSGSGSRRAVGELGRAGARLGADTELPNFDEVVWRGERDRKLEEELRLQLLKAGQKAAAEQLEYAKVQAEKNRRRFAVRNEVVEGLALRSKGREAVEIWSGEELKAVAGEPFVFLRPQSLRTRLGQLKLHFWPLTLAVVRDLEMEERIIGAGEIQAGERDVGGFPVLLGATNRHGIVGKLGERLELAFD